MKTNIPSAAVLLSLCGMLFTAHAADPGIDAAVLPLPVILRDAAGVVRLDEAGQPQLLRNGTNGMVCMADQPGDADFDVRCYQEAFIPVVYRGFQLRHDADNKGNAGESKMKPGAIIDAEIKSGKLPLSNQPSAGYRCLGPISAYDAAHNTLGAQIECWQSVHFPYRTAREIGLPDESEISEELQMTLPYVMSGGRYWAHVMIRHGQSN